MIQVLLASHLATPLEILAPAALVWEDGRISAVGRRDEVTIPSRARVHDYGEAVLAPGYIDLHVHGGGGRDFMSAGAEEIASIGRHLARHGVTSYLATTVTAPWRKTLEAVGRLSRAGVGIHLEGPFLNPKQRGVHPASELLLPTLDRLEELWESSQGLIRWITLAPELEGGLTFIAAATARGIGVSLGHSNASSEEARAGVAAGACHVTHTFNAMRPLHHREPGLAGEALLNPALSAEIIADGIHVDPRMVEMFLRLRGPERAILVSDGISAAGCGDGRFELGGVGVDVSEGRCLVEGRLAGSVLTLDEAVRNVTRFAGWELAAAVRLATLNPARRLKLELKGRLTVGADADVAVLSPAGEVRASYQGGRQVN